MKEAVQTQQIPPLEVTQNSAKIIKLTVTRRSQQNQREFKKIARVRAGRSLRLDIKSVEEKD